MRLWLASSALLLVVALLSACSVEDGDGSAGAGGASTSGSGGQGIGAGSSTGGGTSSGDVDLGRISVQQLVTLAAQN